MDVPPSNSWPIRGDASNKSPAENQGKDNWASLNLT